MQRPAIIYLIVLTQAPVLLTLYYSTDELELPAS